MGCQSESEQAARLTSADLRIELFGHRYTIVPISTTVIQGKNMVKLIMPEEQYYRARNKTVAQVKTRLNCETSAGYFKAR
jgi:hypothetical protein